MANAQWHYFCMSLSFCPSRHLSAVHLRLCFCLFSQCQLLSFFYVLSGVNVSPSLPLFVYIAGSLLLRKDYSTQSRSLHLPPHGCYRMLWALVFLLLWLSVQYTLANITDPDIYHGQRVTYTRDFLLRLSTTPSFQTQALRKLSEATRCTTKRK